MENYIKEHISIIILIIILLISVLFIISTISLIYNIKLNKRINNILGKKRNKKITDIESRIKEYYEKFLILDKNQEEVMRNIKFIKDKLKKCAQKIAIIRYNPFKDMGGDLSYALAVLDENNNGFVINNIFNRENSITYCKPIENGTSNYKLSYEEECAIKKAMGVENKKIRGRKALKKED